MDIEDLIQSYSAIYGSLDSLTVSGVKNCKVISGCAAHIESQLAVLDGIRQAEKEAAAQIQMKAAAEPPAEEPGAGEEDT